MSGQKRRINYKSEGRIEGLACAHERMSEYIMK